jgi:hypothetical protein
MNIEGSCIKMALKKETAFLDKRKIAAETEVRKRVVNE